MQQATSQYTLILLPQTAKEVRINVTHKLQTGPKILFKKTFLNAALKTERVECQ